MLFLEKGCVVGHQSRDRIYIQRIVVALEHPAEVGEGEVFKGRRESIV
jgi:hypothetical protein